jgi:hypothetical protein
VSPEAAGLKRLAPHLAHVLSKKDAIAMAELYFALGIAQSTSHERRHRVVHDLHVAEHILASPECRLLVYVEIYVDNNSEELCLMESKIRHEAVPILSLIPLIIQLLDQANRNM